MFPRGYTTGVSKVDDVDYIVTCNATFICSILYAVHIYAVYSVFSVGFKL